MKIDLQTSIDPDDIDAFYKQVEAIVIKYGEKPQPHLKKDFERELHEAAYALGLCVNIVPVVEE